MTNRNYRLEAEIKIQAEAAGCLPSALADFELDVQTFKVTQASEIPAWIEKCRTEKPHRFAVQSDYDAELAQSAFALRNPNVNAGAKMHRLAGAKIHQRCWQEGPRTGGLFFRHQA